MKKRSRTYKQMMKKYHKSITKLGKDLSKNPWEWSYLSETIIEFLRFMRDYYTAGENVWQTDDTRLPIIESLNAAIHEYDRWQECEHDYVKTFIEEGDYFRDLHTDAIISKTHFAIKDRKTGNITQYDDEPDFIIEKSGLTGTNMYYWYLNNDMKTAYELAAKEEAEHRMKFFEIIGKNIESWWD